MLERFRLNTWVLSTTVKWFESSEISQLGSVLLAVQSETVESSVKKDDKTSVRR
jgi:hypothetical protein